MVTILFCFGYSLFFSFFFRRPTPLVVCVAFGKHSCCVGHVRGWFVFVAPCLFFFFFPLPPSPKHLDWFVFLGVGYVWLNPRVLWEGFPLGPDFFFFLLLFFVFDCPPSPSPYFPFNPHFFGGLGLRWFVTPTNPPTFATFFPVEPFQSLLFAHPPQ